MINKEGYTKYELINYFDVWGNAEDGYKVNNQCIEFDDLHITNDATNKDIFVYLQSIGFLNQSAKFEQVNFECLGERIEISQASDNMPICALDEVI